LIVVLQTRLHAFLPLVHLQVGAGLVGQQSNRTYATVASEKLATELEDDQKTTPTGSQQTDEDDDDKPPSTHTVHS